MAIEAFESWKKVSVPKRARILFKYQQLLINNKNELARIITKENGKTIEDALGEVQRGIECVNLQLEHPH